MDFTLKVFRRLLESLAEAGYSFQTIKDNFQCSASRAIVLRHDVDKMPLNSLGTARIENDLGVKGTYFFRTAGSIFNEDVIKEISRLGHEIGYHYEDMDLARQKAKDKRQELKVRKSGINGEEELANIAIESFRDNLAKFREAVQIVTICMHGSPMSPVDSRLIWKYYDYGDDGIMAEPYFDFSLEKMLYLTDTGRRWDGASFSIRDKAIIRDPGFYSGWKRKPLPGSAMSMTEKAENLQKNFRFSKTGDILAAGRAHLLPEKIMMTFHSQRWSDRYGEWAKEVVFQNLKNQIKYLINKY